MIENTQSKKKKKDSAVINIYVIWEMEKIILSLCLFNMVTNCITFNVELIKIAILFLTDLSLQFCMCNLVNMNKKYNENY